MECQPTVFWDFDGTLGYREGMFSGALYKVLKELMPESTITIKDIGPFLQQGFPWQQPKESYCHLSNPKDWWFVIEDIFYKAYKGLGVDDKYAKELAKSAHECYINPEGFLLYEDTIETLKYFCNKGWRNVILSNHVPELPQIVNSLGLGGYIYKCISSANIGYEKPNSESFYIALASAGNPNEVWMVGDSLKADIEGAESVGIKAILVHTDNKVDTKYYSKELKGVIDIIEKGASY